MILERLYLENYKQFRDPLELFPPEGAVGVIGANGSGKTSIFEAILWTFFGSRGGGPRFANDAIPWSGGAASDKTLVEVTLNVGGEPYKVSRSLYRNKTEAHVYNRAEEEVVGGSSEVAGWVQEHLLGMDRVAFEATFFARQKELEFFAGVTGVERQREVARILGIDQVEAAQKLLRADRKDLRSEVAALERFLEETDYEALSRDLSEAREEHQALETEAGRAEKALSAAGKKLAEAREEAEKLEKLYREHTRLSSALHAAESSRERAADRAGELREKLSSLDKDEKTIEELRPRIEGTGRVSGEIEVLEEARRRGERRESAAGELKRRRSEAQRAVVDASKLLDDLDGAESRGVVEEPMPGWEELVSVEDDVRRMYGAAELLEGTPAAHGEAEERYRGLQETRKRFEDLAVREKELSEAREACEAGRAEVERLDGDLAKVSGGKPEERAARLRREEGSLQRQSVMQQGLAEADEKEARKLAGARRMIEDSSEVAECPTCKRDFKPDEHEEVIGTLSRQAEKLLTSAGEARAECRRLEKEATDLDRELQEVEQLQRQAQKLEESRAVAAARQEGLEKALGRTREQAETLREDLSGSVPVGDAELEEARSREAWLRTIREDYPRLAGLVTAYETADASVSGLEAEIKTLDEAPPYDPGRHRRLLEEKAELDRLSGRIETLKSRLEERPGVEERLETAVEEEKAASGKSTGLREELEALSFDEEVYAESRGRAAEAERARDAAREEREEIGGKLRRLAHRVEGLQSEVRRYDEQRKLADERAAKAASLGEMDKLFSEFYRELTARVRPVLEDEASALVRTLTDGRYERMEFDHNYGVRLFDGLSDAYEISRFSGGEADVVSLSARVALSKMISARGSEALGFLVLDEVFGALDTDRRRNVLLALDRLKKAFGQIFVISHVGDVQESALLDELWSVEEDEDGKSTVRRIQTASPATGIEELSDITR